MTYRAFHRYRMKRLKHKAKVAAVCVASAVVGGCLVWKLVSLQNP